MIWHKQAMFSCENVILIAEKGFAINCKIDANYSETLKLTYENLHTRAF